MTFIDWLIVLVLNGSIIIYAFLRGRETHNSRGGPRRRQAAGDFGRSNKPVARKALCATEGGNRFVGSHDLIHP